ncbi:MAG: hypothetical protein ACOC97_06255 [Myxococcota bacterium]
MRARSSVTVLCFVTFSVAVATPDSAAAQTARCIEQLDDDELDARYHTIYRAFEKQQLHGRLWYLGWMTVFTGLTAANVAFAATEFDDARPRAILAAVGSGFSILSLTIFPRTGTWAGWGAKRLRAMPADTIEERRERLRYAEAMLEKSATRQKLGTSFLTHSQGYAWGLFTGLLLGLKYDDTLGALMLALGSPIINELRVLTQPTASIPAWENYRSAAKHCMAPTLRRLPQPNREPRIDISAGPGQVSFGVRWF